MQIHRVPHGVAGYAERISLPSPNGHTTRRWPEISPRSANYQQFQEHSRKGLVTVEFDVGRGTPRRFGPWGGRAVGVLQDVEPTRKVHIFLECVCNGQRILPERRTAMALRSSKEHLRY
jgi:hypothetical protein